MDAAIVQRFTPYLASDETPLWVGRPVQGFSFQHGDLITVPMAVMWLAFAAWWLSLIGSNDRISNFVLGAVFVLIGFDLVFGRYLRDAYVRARTYYLLSDRHALILSGWRGKSLTSVGLDGVSEINFVPDRDDRGTIIFGPTNDPEFWQARSRRATSPEFFKVERALTVYGLIQGRRQS